MKKYIVIAIAILLISLGATGVAKAGGGVTWSSTPIHGWAWSSNTGWVSFNSTDSGTGNGGVGTSPVAYSVTVSTSSADALAGVFGGYAWSPSVGWISFNNDASSALITDCGPVATVDLSSGTVSGWARVISEVGRTDGWDGCIKLSDGVYFRSPDYGTISVSDSLGVLHSLSKGGVTFAPTTGKFGGFAWSGAPVDPITGSNSGVLGWLSFDAAGPTNGVTLCPTGGCVPVGNTPTVTLVPDSPQVQSGSSTMLRWTSSDVTSCTASVGWSGSKAVSGSQSTGNLTNSTSYTLTCTGPDGPASANATVAVVTNPNPPAACDPSTAVCLNIDNTNVAIPALTSIRIKKGTDFELGWSNPFASSGYTCTARKTESDGSDSSNLFSGWTNTYGVGKTGALSTTNVPVGQYNFSISCVEKANPVNIMTSNNGIPVSLTVYTSTAEEI